MTGQFDNSLGHRECYGISAIEVQGQQGVLKCCRQRRNVLRREYPSLLRQKRQNRHSTPPKCCRWTQAFGADGSLYPKGNAPAG